MRIGGKLIFYTERSIVPEEKSDAEIRLLLLQIAEVEKMHPPFSVISKANKKDIMRDTRGLSFFISENKKWFAS